VRPPGRETWWLLALTVFLQVAEHLPTLALDWRVFGALVLR